MTDKTGYIVANLTRGIFDGIYTADLAHLAESVAAWRTEFPGDLIVTAKLLDWPGPPFDTHFAHKVRWMNEHREKAEKRAHAS